MYPTNLYKPMSREELIAKGRLPPSPSEPSPLSSSAPSSSANEVADGSHSKRQQTPPIAGVGNAGPPGSASVSSLRRRGLDRLSGGLREFKTEVLSRRAARGATTPAPTSSSSTSASSPVPAASSASLSGSVPHRLSSSSSSAAKTSPDRSRNAPSPSLPAASSAIARSASSTTPPISAVSGSSSVSPSTSLAALTNSVGIRDDCSCQNGQTGAATNGTSTSSSAQSKDGTQPFTGASIVATPPSMSPSSSYSMGSSTDNTNNLSTSAPNSAKNDGFAVKIKGTGHSDSLDGAIHHLSTGMPYRKPSTVLSASSALSPGPTSAASTGPLSAASTTSSSMSALMSAPSSVNSSNPMRKAPNFVLVTQDHESLSRVNISGLPTPAAIRERLYARACISDDDIKHSSLHLSSLDTADPGPALSDNEVWATCQAVLRGEVHPAPLFFVALAPPGSDAQDAASIPGTDPISSANGGPTHDTAHARPPPSPLTTTADAPAHLDASERTSANHPSAIAGQSRSHTQDQSSGLSFGNSSLATHLRRASDHDPPQSSLIDDLNGNRRASAGATTQLHTRASSADRSRFSSGDLPGSESPAELSQAVWTRRQSSEAVQGIGGLVTGSPHLPPIRQDQEWPEPRVQTQAHGISRRQDRQYQSEATPASAWDTRPGDIASMRASGFSPSGPIFMSPQLSQGHSSNVMTEAAAFAGRPRSNSGSFPQTGAPAGPSGSISKSRPAPNAGFGPSGPLHFPQPGQHAKSVPQPRQAYPPQQMYDQAYERDNAANTSRNVYPAKSMDNMRPFDNQSAATKSQNPMPTYPAYARVGPSNAHSQHHGTLSESAHSHRMQPTTSEAGSHLQRAQTAFLPPAVSDTGSQMHRAHTASTSQSRTASANYPPPSAQPRLPPINATNRIPSYPPYSPGQYSQGPATHDRQLSADQIALMPPRAPSAIHQLAGPQRIALQPGETVQEAMRQQQLRQQRQRDQQTSQHSRTPSLEKTMRPQYSPSGHQALSLQEQQLRKPQFVDDAAFAQSPPPAFPETMPAQPSPRLNAFERQDEQRRSKTSPPASIAMHTPSSQESEGRSPSHAARDYETRSPASSRPSTSSEPEHIGDRPGSYSSASTTDLVTPINDNAPQSLAGGKAATASANKQSHRMDNTASNDAAVYAGVDLLRDRIDAATVPTPSPSAGKVMDFPGDSTAINEESDTLKGKEWSDAFVKMHNTNRDKPAESSGPNKAANQRTADGRSKTESRFQHPKRIPIPAPIIAYNPDEDDDDDVMTWAVQMQPTKPVVGKEVTPTTPPDRQVLDTSAGLLVTPKRDEDANLPSPRSDRPALRVQTNAFAGESDAPTGTSKTATNHQLPLTVRGVDTERRSPSPRSAGRRARQVPAEYPFMGMTPASASRTPDRERQAGVENVPSASREMDRRASFDTNNWAFRPPVEQVYDNLEDFFPNHDLDKPIVDASSAAPNSGMSSPGLEALPQPSPTAARQAAQEAETSAAVPSNSSKSTQKVDTVPELPIVPAAPSDPGRRFNQNRKSMRMVAQDRKIRLKRDDVAVKPVLGPMTEREAKLARRKSTKVWGKKIEEVTAAEAELLNSAKLDSPGRDEGSIKWVKGELIGKGTYGHVFLGFNVTNGEMIAVKQVDLPRTANDKDDARQQGVVEALKSEMELLKDLEHEKIVSYLGFEQTSAHLSILLEYVPGGSVGRCLRKHGKFEKEVIQFFTTQILEGLEYLHQRGILHRDLKADNILVKMDGTIKISDFGISKKSNDIYNNNSNMSMQGSIFWMAPEVVSNARKGYSAKIDIWSLGCVVLEMFAGRRPWDSEEAIQAMFKLGAERLAPPVPADVKLTSQASHFLKECFHGDPEKRPVASKLLCHKFLTLDKDWEFQMSSLYKAMNA